MMWQIGAVKAAWRHLRVGASSKQLQCFSKNNKLAVKKGKQAYCI